MPQGDDSAARIPIIVHLLQAAASTTFARVSSALNETPVRSELVPRQVVDLDGGWRHPAVQPSATEVPMDPPATLLGGPPGAPKPQAGRAAGLRFGVRKGRSNSRKNSQDMPTATGAKTKQRSSTEVDSLTDSHGERALSRCVSTRSWVK